MKPTRRKPAARIIVGEARSALGNLRIDFDEIAIGSASPVTALPIAGMTLNE